MSKRSKLEKKALKNCLDIFDKGELEYILEYHNDTISNKELKIIIKHGHDNEKMNRKLIKYANRK